MTYLLKYKPIKRNRYKKIVVVIFMTTILFFIFYFLSGSLTSPVSKIIIPISRISKSIKKNISLGLQLFEPKSSLISENKSLKENVAELKSKIFDSEMILNDNAVFREKLGFISVDYILANVLLMPPMMPFDTILIDKGAFDNVSVGATVLVSEKTALGYVEEVYKNSSRIRMYSSSEVKTSAVFLKDGTLVELMGLGGGNFLLETPIGFDIEEGDFFLIPGADRLVLARVGSVIRKESSTFTSVLLKIPVRVSANSTLKIQVRKSQ